MQTRMALVKIPDCLPDAPNSHVAVDPVAEWIRHHFSKGVPSGYAGRNHMIMEVRILPGSLLTMYILSWFWFLLAKQQGLGYQQQTAFALITARRPTRGGGRVELYRNGEDTGFKRLWTVLGAPMR